MVSVSKISTQTRTDEGRVVYRVRGDQDIWNYIRFICKGDNIGKRNFNEMNFDPDRLAAEMIYVQDIYGKTSGIRLRGLILAIDKNELSDEALYEQIAEIAYQYCWYIGNKGFQVLYRIFEEESLFEIWYIINSTSYQNGYKFAYDMDEATRKAVEIVSCIVSNKRVDHSGLEFYPYSH